jgi:hypothetical protein
LRHHSTKRYQQQTYPHKLSPRRSKGKCVQLLVHAIGGRVMS